MNTEAPPDRDALAALLADATAAGTRLAVRGAGSARPAGIPSAIDGQVSTRGLDRVVDHQPADLTLTVEAGLPASRVHELAAAHGQVWPQPAHREGASVGGILATAAGGLDRLRWGPVRDSVLEIVVCTGDGRLVRAGGRTVKGVAGYDVPRLQVGARGTLGVIVEATLKLWPRPLSSGWFVREDDGDVLRGLAARLTRDVYRPAALVREPGRLWLHLIGAPADVRAPAGLTAVDAPRVDLAAPAVMDLAVSPALLPTLARDLDDASLRYRALLGVGTCRVEVPTPDEIGPLRTLATARGGHGEVFGPNEFRADPWGPAPPGLAIMRRLRDAFDPGGVLNPGAFVGDAPARV
ncbi:MAG: FAD-binding protein [Thermoleophilia bacterium]|nr:FAD-binding protein [Thermoleophilia bacterium]